MHLLGKGCRLENTHHPHQIVPLDLPDYIASDIDIAHDMFDGIICRQYSMNTNRTIVAFSEHLASVCIVYTLVLQYTSNIRSNVYSNERCCFEDHIVLFKIRDYESIENARNIRCVIYKEMNFTVISDESLKDWLKKK